MKCRTPEDYKRKQRGYRKRHAHGYKKKHSHYYPMLLDLYIKKLAKKHREVVRDWTPEKPEKVCSLSIEELRSCWGL